MVRRWIGSAGLLGVMLWVLAGCAGEPAAEKAPIAAEAGMKTVTLTVEGMS